MPKMHSTAVAALPLFFALLLAAAPSIGLATTIPKDEPQQQQQDTHNNAMLEKQPTAEIAVATGTIPHQRRSIYYAMMQSIGTSKEATRWGCLIVRPSFCQKFEKTLNIERTRRGTVAAVAADPAMVAMMDGIIPNDVTTMLDRTTIELRKTTETSGFYEMSQKAQENIMLETAGRQGDIVKDKLKETIEGARKMIERALGTIIAYSEMPMETKIEMEQVFLTLTDETKTAKQKFDRIKEIEQKWTQEMREVLKPSTDDKTIMEAVQFFTNVPQQIELGKN